jgi:hypothetical protein
MPAGQLAALRQFVRLFVIHPSASGCGGTGQNPFGLWPVDVCSGFGCHFGKLQEAAGH